MNNSLITRDGIIDIQETNFKEKNITSKTKNLYILLVLLLITIALLIAASRYCNLIAQHYHFMTQN